jgi:hypothetical protein
MCICLCGLISSHIGFQYRESQPLVTIEVVEFENQLVEAQDFRKAPIILEVFTKIYHKIMRKKSKNPKDVNI